MAAPFLARGRHHQTILYPRTGEPKALVLESFRAATQIHTPPPVCARYPLQPHLCQDGADNRYVVDVEFPQGHAVRLKPSEDNQSVHHTMANVMQRKGWSRSERGVDRSRDIDSRDRRTASTGRAGRLFRGIERKKGKTPYALERGEAADPPTRLPATCTHDRPLHFLFFLTAACNTQWKTRAADIYTKPHFRLSLVPFVPSPALQRSQQAIRIFRITAEQKISFALQLHSFPARNRSLDLSFPPSFSKRTVFRLEG